MVCISVGIVHCTYIYIYLSFSLFLLACFYDRIIKWKESTVLLAVLYYASHRISLLLLLAVAAGTNRGNVLGIDSILDFISTQKAHLGNVRGIDQILNFGFVIIHLTNT